MGDKDGKVSLDEMMKEWVNEEAQDDEKEELTKLIQQHFSEADLDKDELLSKEEFNQVSIAMHTAFEGEDSETLEDIAAETLEILDTDKDGLVSLEEFYADFAE